MQPDERGGPEQGVGVGRVGPPPEEVVVTPDGVVHRLEHLRAQRLAAELGLAIVTPDTSPRGTDFPEQSDHWDFGVAAGFYLDATEARPSCPFCPVLFHLRRLF